MTCFSAFVLEHGAISEVINEDYGVGVAWKR
jgi:hypothetical protein